MRKTHYDVLQVSRDASPEVIRAAYRARQRQLHPDLTGVESDEIRELNEAYGILNDPARRLKYDETLEVVTVSADPPESSGSVHDTDHDWGEGVEWGESQDVEEDWGVEVEWGESHGQVDTEVDAPTQRRAWLIILRKPVSLVSGLIWLAITGVTIILILREDPSGVGVLLSGAAVSMFAGITRIRRSRTPILYYLFVVFFGAIVIFGFIDYVWGGLFTAGWFVSYVVAVESAARSDV